MTRCLRVLLAELLAPLADGFVGHDDAALGEQLLDVTITEGEAEVQPDRMADDRGREPVPLVVGS